MYLLDTNVLGEIRKKRNANLGVQRFFERVKQIAATAIINGLTVVTRNTRDYQITGAKVLDPFEGSPVYTPCLYV